MPPKTSSPIPTVSAATARRLLLGAQGLLDDPRRKATPDALYELIERMGFVQIDSINVVERAHHLILAARMQGYQPRLLERLLERQRRLFEHWTHDASPPGTPTGRSASSAIGNGCWSTPGGWSASAPSQEK